MLLLFTTVAEAGVDEHDTQQRRHGHVQRDAVCTHPYISSYQDWR